MALYDLIAPLPLRIEGYTLEGLVRAVSSGFERKSTMIALAGAGEEGRGEDVTYEAGAHDAQQQAGPVLDLAGEFTFDPSPSTSAASTCSPATRLSRTSTAVTGAGASSRPRSTSRCARPDVAARVLGRTPEPVTFVVSSRMGQPPTIAPVTRRLAVYPGLRFKLDATPDWPEELIDQLQETGAVDSIDFKGAYKGTVVDTPTDPDFYRHIARPSPTPGSRIRTSRPRRPATRSPPTRTGSPGTRRSTVQDILDAPVMPRTVNLKPSRFGSVKSLFEGYEFCEQRGMGAYGGGQYELGVGRGHVQLLAALFHPNAPNDIAPGGYDALDPEPGLPTSPLDVDPAPIGFRRAID